MHPLVYYRKHDGDERSNPQPHFRTRSAARPLAGLPDRGVVAWSVHDFCVRFHRSLRAPEFSPTRSSPFTAASKGMDWPGHGIDCCRANLQPMGSMVWSSYEPCDNALVL